MSGPKNAIEAIGRDIMTRITHQNTELARLRAIEDKVKIRQSKRCEVGRHKIYRENDRDRYCSLCKLRVCDDCTDINFTDIVCDQCSKRMCACMRMKQTQCARCPTYICSVCTPPYTCKCGRVHEGICAECVMEIKWTFSELCNRCRICKCVTDFDWADAKCAKCGREWCAECAKEYDTCCGF